MLEAAPYGTAPAFKNLWFICLFRPNDGRYTILRIVPEVSILRRLSFAVMVACGGSQIIVIVSDTYLCPIALRTIVIYDF